MTARQEPNGERPPTIFFLHIPKTAGLTLRELIWRQYGRNETFIPTRTGRDQHRRRDDYLRWIEEGGERPPARNRLRTDPQVERLATLSPERLAQLRVVMGHLWFGIHEAIPGPHTYLTLLRDPIDRVLSTYHHRATRHGLAMSVEDYVRSERDTRMDNAQTRRLATASRSDARDGPVTPEMFDSAVRNLGEHFSVVGLTERFDLSVLAMARTFGWRRLGYVAYNVSRGRPRAEDLPGDVLAILRRHSEYDLELLRIARTLLDRQVKTLGIDPERDVAAYRQRLRRYQRVRPLYDGIRAAAGRLRRRGAPRQAALREQRHV